MSYSTYSSKYEFTYPRSPILIQLFDWLNTQMRKEEQDHCPVNLSQETSDAIYTILSLQPPSEVLQTGDWVALLNEYSQRHSLKPPKYCYELVTVGRSIRHQCTCTLQTESEEVIGQTASSGTPPINFQTKKLAKQYAAQILYNMVGGGD